MKKFLSLSAFSLFAFSLFAQVDADLVIKKGEDIEINGIEDDAIWSAIEAVPIGKAFNSDPSNPLGEEMPTLGEEGETYFKVFYSDTYIYLLVNVNDDVQTPWWNSADFPNKPGDSWKYDKAEFYLDVNHELKDGNGPVWAAGEQDAGHHQFAPYIAPIVTRADGVSTYDETDEVWGTIYTDITDANWNAFSGNNTYAFSKIEPAGYVLEARLEIAALTNTAGDTFTAETLQNLPEGAGLDVLIADNDGSGRNRAVWMNAGPEEPYNNMDGSGVAVFVEEEIIVPEPEDAVLVIKKGEDIEINGIEDDAIWSAIEAVPIVKPFNADPSNPLGEEIPTLGAEGETYFKIFYSDTYIYLLVNVNDDVFTPWWNSADFPNKPGDSWKYDKAEFYLDVNHELKDGNGPVWAAGEQDAGHHQFAPYIAPIVTRADGVSTYDETDEVWGTIYTDITDANWNAFSGNNTYAFSKIEPAGYVLEARLEIAALTNTAGDTFTAETLQNLPEGAGLDVLIADNDGSGRNRAVWMNAGPEEPYNNMDGSGVAVFSPEDVAVGIFKPIAPVSEITVYPNPVKSVLRIDGKFDRVTIINISGQMVKSVRTNNSVDVSNLHNGMYIIHAYDNDVMVGVSKFTKN